VLRRSDHSAQHQWPQHHPPRPRAACSAAAATSQHLDLVGRSFATHRPTPLVRYGGQNHLLSGSPITCHVPYQGCFLATACWGCYPSG
jgi:hypothetical protein